MTYFRYISILLFWVATSVVAQKRIFPAESYQSEQGYVYQFIDRYFYELGKINKSSDLLQKLNDDKVYFAQGTVSDIANLSETTPFTLNRIEDRYFEVTWREEEKVNVTILFPVSFELLLGKTKADIEKGIESEIKASGQLKRMVIPSKDQLIPLSDGVFHTNPRQHYELESLNDCCYYIEDSLGKFHLLKAQDKLEFSVLNMMHYCPQQDYTIEVEQNVYGFKQQHFTMQLSQWLSYCKSKNITIYAAMEEELADVLKILVVAECKELAFNHMLSIYVPKDCLSNSSKAWKAQMNAYIPTHNVKNLYQQYQKRAKREIAL